MIAFILVCAILAMAVALFFGMFMLLRNEWVCKVRLKCLDDSKWTGGGHDPYDRLPSYDFMLYRFWVWDINKFL